MARVVALMRAINVGGTGVIKMTDLKKMFESFGCADVSTYIQSGNVLFSTTAKDPQAWLAAKLAPKKLTAIVLDRAALVSAAKANPLGAITDDVRVHFHFLADAPSAESAAKLVSTATDQYTWAVKKRVVYYSYATAIGGKRKTVNIDKILGVAGTSRNANVVDKLIELLGDT